MPRRWQRVRDAIVEAAVTVDIVDVGGGFPSWYPGMEPPALETYFDVIHRAFEDLPISYSAELWCEPGRALCAEYASVLVRVEKRRGSELYINDGAYGALFDAAHIGWRFPVKLVREEESKARPDGVQLLRPDLRRPRPYGGPVRAARRRPGRRLYRDRHARRLWLRDAHRLQRLRRSRIARSSTTSRWPRSIWTTRNASARRTSSSCKAFHSLVNLAPRRGSRLHF